MSTRPRRRATPPLRTVIPDEESRKTFWWTVVSVHVVWATGCWTWALGVVPARTAAGLTVALVAFAALTLNALWMARRPVVFGGVVLAGLVRLLTIVGATTPSGLLMGLGAGLAALLLGSTRLLAGAQHGEPRRGPGRPSAQRDPWTPGGDGPPAAPG